MSTKSLVWPWLCPPFACVVFFCLFCFFASVEATSKWKSYAASPLSLFEVPFITVMIESKIGMSCKTAIWVIQSHPCATSSWRKVSLALPLFLFVVGLNLAIVVVTAAARLLLWKWQTGPKVFVGLSILVVPRDHIQDWCFPFRISDVDSKGRSFLQLFSFS